MTIYLSVSNEIKDKNLNGKWIGCDNIIKKLKQQNIEGKMVPNISIINGNEELGCTIMLNDEYKNKENLKKLWNLIKFGINSPELQFKENKYKVSIQLSTRNYT